tara:strand:+ start:378 stop:602 length:225 start_codon:yes stop_codon:yes gene_type:complete
MKNKFELKNQREIIKEWKLLDKNKVSLFNKENIENSILWISKEYGSYLSTTVFRPCVEIKRRLRTILNKRYKTL